MELVLSIQKLSSAPYMQNGAHYNTAMEVGQLSFADSKREEASKEARFPSNSL
jgi:hypothetical protein